MERRRRGQAADVRGGRPGVVSTGSPAGGTVLERKPKNRPEYGAEEYSMSIYNIHVPEPSQIDYHSDLQAHRVERAKKLIDVGDVIAIVESRLASEPAPRAHPLFPVFNFLLDRQTAVDGGAFWDAWKTLCLGAIDTAIDDALDCLGEG